MDNLMIHTLLIAGFVTALLQTVGHYFKWEVWIGHELHRLMGYAWGVISMLVGLFMWAYLMGLHREMKTWESLTAFIIVALASGGTVLGLYGLDALGERVHYARARDLMDASEHDGEGGK